MGRIIRYRVVKYKSFPAMSVKQLAIHRKCYLGVSINNPFFKGDHLGLFLKWISNHFDECIIVLGDHLHRINETIQYGLTRENAIQAALKKGDELLSILQAAVDNQNNNVFKVYRWKDYLDNNLKIYTDKQEIYTYFNSNEQFRNEIVQTSTDFINRLIKNNENLYYSKEESIKLSHEYLIEEIAVFNNLIEQGYKVQVYPGSELNILKKFTTGEFDDLNLTLKKGVYFYLDIKKRKR